MKKTNFILLLLLVSFHLIAQSRFDVFTVGGNYNFMQTTSTSPAHNYESSLLANFSFPLIFKDSSVWISIADYQSYSVFNNYFPEDSFPIKKFDLHGFILRTGYVYRIDASHGLQALIIPRYMGDFNASFPKSFQLGAMMMYETKKSDALTWRAGILYNEECFGPQLTPVFFLDWKLTGKVRFTGLLPIYGKLYWQSTEKFSSGLHFVGLTTSYRINEPGYKNYYVERNSIDISYFSNLQIVKNIFLEARLGYSINKDFALYEENQKIDLALPLLYIGDNRVRANGEYKGSPMFHLRLLYSLPVN